MSLYAQWVPETKTFENICFMKWYAFRREKGGKVRNDYFPYAISMIAKGHCCDFANIATGRRKRKSDLNNLSLSNTRITCYSFVGRCPSGPQAGR